MEAELQTNKEGEGLWGLRWLAVPTLMHSWHSPGVARPESHVLAPLLRITSRPVGASLWFPVDSTLPDSWGLMLAKRG